MSDIDEKLLAILSKLQGWSWSLGKDVIDMSDDGMAEECLVEIKQVFAEAGYVSFAESHPLDFDKHSLMMTGAEWYRAFEKEFEKATEEPSWDNWHDVYVLMAARRAAGLETEGRG